MPLPTPLEPAPATLVEGRRVLLKREDAHELGVFKWRGARLVLEPPGAVVVPVGNGALLGGIGRAVARRSPATLRIGVVAKGAPTMADSWEAKQPVDSLRSETFADGLAVRVAIPAAVAPLAEAADRMLRVSERSIARAVAAYSEVGIRAEGAAGAALAALPQLADVDDPIVLVVTGRNIDDSVLEMCRESPESFPE